MEKRSNILLISYVFPPYYGIGGRRWAKQADELTKLGFNIHVICAKNPFKTESLWSDLIQKNPNIFLYPLSRRFPKVMVDFDHHFFHKYLYKFWSIILPFIVRGTPMDRSVFWKKSMLNKAAELINEYNINKVICTGGPFSAMYYSTFLKEKFSNITLINDMRDPWTWGPNWGYPSLNSKRMEYEKNMERITIEKSDYVTVPNQEMLNYLHLNYPQFKNKIIEIPHFFDPNELSVLKKTKSEKIRLVYYGNIYEGIEEFLEITSKFFAAHLDKFELDFYTDKTSHLFYFQKKRCKNVRTFPQEPAKQLFAKFSGYDYVFIMTPDYGKNNVSTKFFEIIYTKTPIIIFSNKGYAGQFIESNRLGIFIDPNNFEERMLDLYTNRNFKFNDEFDISEYALNNIARKISNLFVNNIHPN